MYFYIYIYQSEYIRVWSGEYEYRREVALYFDL